MNHLQDLQQILINVYGFALTPESDHLHLGQIIKHDGRVPSLYMNSEDYDSNPIVAFSTKDFVIQREIVQQRDIGMPMQYDFVYTKRDWHFIGELPILLMLVSQGITSRFQVFRNTVMAGFSERDQKWYGWAQPDDARGFGIGSRLEIGDPGYVPRNEEEAERIFLQSWQTGDNEHHIGRIQHNILVHGKLGFTYDHMTIYPDGGMEVTNDNFQAYPEQWGCKTEAETLDDAKQMAINYACRFL